MTKGSRMVGRHSWASILLVVIMGAACTGPLLVYRSVSSASQASQQEAVLTLRKLVEELRDLAKAIPANASGSGGAGAGAGGGGSRQQWDELQAQFVDLRADLEAQVQQLVEVQGGLRDYFGDSSNRAARMELEGQQQQRKHRQLIEQLPGETRSHWKEQGDMQQDEIEGEKGGERQQHRDSEQEGQQQNENVLEGQQERQGQQEGQQQQGEQGRWGQEQGRGRFWPLDRVAAQPVAIQRLAQPGHYLASPSLVHLHSGRLLAVYEKSVPWGTGDTSQKLVAASDDGGASWRDIATVGPMNWPQVFRCASGVYVIGTQRHFSPDNNLVISRMLAPDGTNWSAPAQLTSGWSVVAANTGVDVSGGRVTKTFELIPSMSMPLTTTTLIRDVEVPIDGGPEGPSWRRQPEVDVVVRDVRGFVQYTLVKAPLGGRALFFRVMEVLPQRRLLRLRLERFNLYWQTKPLTLRANTSLAVSSGANVYGGVDWVAMAMSAEEGDDLTRPEAWVFASPPLGNPAAVLSNELRALFDVAFRADTEVRKSIIGFDVPALEGDPQTAWEAGFGSVYWMEGVVTRLRDRHGGNGKLLSLMRVNNDLLCDLAAVVEFDDSQVGRLSGRFLRYTFVPGLGVGHPAILYDPDSDLYWMASNVNRDATRQWKQPDSPSTTQPQLHITAFSKCEVDRSTLALFYSPNLLNWVMAGLIDYHLSLARHFAYPHMILDGSDLLVVSRAALEPPGSPSSPPTSPPPELDPFYNNHNSNAIAFHRVRGFRALANVEWAREQGAYSAHPRRTSIVEEAEREAARRRAAEAEEERRRAAEAEAALKRKEQQQAGQAAAEDERQRPVSTTTGLDGIRWLERPQQGQHGLGEQAADHLKFGQRQQQQ